MEDLDKDTSENPKQSFSYLGCAEKTVLRKLQCPVNQYSLHTYFRICFEYVFLLASLVKSGFFVHLKNAYLCSC